MSSTHPGHPRFRIPSNADHERISALFLGSKGENADFLQSWFASIVNQQRDARLAYFPEDQPSITASIQQSPAFNEMTSKITNNLTELLTLLGEKSIPFYSPRYSAHMCVDQSLPAILGYISTMFYNPNNVAFEASPFTTLLELEVGLQLCEMMGYNRINDSDIDEPVAWGHIACDGSVANLESVCDNVGRNLKFYPLSLRDASAEGCELAFIRDSFYVETCQGEKKLLKDCIPWELLNLKVDTILDMPDRLRSDYRISPEFLDSVMSKYIIQTINKDILMTKWHIGQEPAILASNTKHYSWPKAAAITGIGSANLIDAPLDKFARIDTAKLDAALQKCFDEGRAIYQVVAVIGTTEEGAVDRLDEIIKLRAKYQAMGMSFVVHADAAWGGYFASMLHKKSPRRAGDGKGRPKDRAEAPEPFVPHVGLREDTALQLEHLKFADSITVDPHKAGYIPYPAGALCYRDGRMKNLLTWTASYLHQGTSGESIGIYGVEGSKPGAAAAAVYMAHEAIGLTPSGHGSLLGQAMYTCRRYAAHWSAMSTDDTSFIVVPFNPIPAELEPSPDPEKIEEQKKFIRQHILNKPNTVIYNNAQAMELLNKLGSDLNINAFACNFRLRDGTVNNDVEEANWLNRRIFERLSVTSAEEDPLSIPFYLTSTTFSEHEYGVCAEEMRRRMGLQGKQDVVVLRNVVMSPFTTTDNFVGKMADTFQKVLEEEVENARVRNELKPSIHTFLVHGTGSKVFLIHTPSIHMASGRRQIILSVNMGGELHGLFDKVRSGYAATEAMIVHNDKPMLLDDIVDGSTFEGVLSLGRRRTGEKVRISDIKVVKKRSLMTEDLDASYPSLMPFYLYGTPESMHLDHMLLMVPNIQLSAGKIGCKFDKDLSADELAKGVVVVASNVHEASMQPFPIMKYLNIDDKFFFDAGKTLNVVVYRDPYPSSTMDPVEISKVVDVITKGEITLVGNLYVDTDALNVASETPADMPLSYTKHGRMKDETVKSWKHALDKFHHKMA